MKRSQDYVAIGLYASVLAVALLQVIITPALSGIDVSHGLALTAGWAQVAISATTIALVGFLLVRKQTRALLTSTWMMVACWALVAGYHLVVGLFFPLYTRYQVETIRAMLE